MTNAYLRHWRNSLPHAEKFAEHLVDTQHRYCSLTSAV
jgi:hypothetical protein